MSPPGAERAAPVRPLAQVAHRDPRPGQSTATERLHDELHAIQTLADEGAAILARGMLGLDWELDDDLAGALVGWFEAIRRRADLIGRLL